MWRSDLGNPTRRLDKFNQACSRIEGFFAELKTTRCVNKIVCFPDTQNFADIAVTLSGLDGLAVYWNPDEQDYLPQMQACVQNGK
jgi:capsule polysaccharide modification protein KpsS